MSADSIFQPAMIVDAARDKSDGESYVLARLVIFKQFGYDYRQ
jgi:hypothetical protein